MEGFGELADDWLYMFGSGKGSQRVWGDFSGGFAGTIVAEEASGHLGDVGAFWNKGRYGRAGGQRVL